MTYYIDSNYDKKIIRDSYQTNVINSGSEVCNESVFNTVDDKLENTTEFETANTSNNSMESQFDELTSSWELAQAEQGIIGDMINGIKNLFKTEYSSETINQEIKTLEEKIENNTATQDEIDAMKQKIEEYKEKQDSTIDKATTTAASASGAFIGGKLGAMVGAAFPPFGVIVGAIAGTIIGGVAGACTKVGLEQLENNTDNIESNDWVKEDVIEDAKTGAKTGAISGAIAGALNTLFPDKGLDIQEKGAKKILAKFFRKMLLQKNGSKQKFLIYSSAMAIGTFLNTTRKQTSSAA